MAADARGDDGLPRADGGDDGDDEHPNPFLVLGLPITAGTRELEREGQKRLAMIAAGVAPDCSPEAEHRVRQALDELRDPRRRLSHEIRTLSLPAGDAARSELPKHLQLLAGTLPSATPSSHALAEALLWQALRWPEPFALPPNHADETLRAFPAERSSAAAADLGETMDYAELVAFHPPTRAARPERAGKKKR